jgi:hypothetical protein
MEDYSTERSWAIYIHPESNSVWIAENGINYEDPLVYEYLTDLTIAEAREKRDMQRKIRRCD